MDDNGSVSLRICLDGHANSLALNKENSCIAVAGRSLLKVFNIDNDGFSEVHNMRQQQGNNKNLNLTFSSSAIAWSQIDQNILATSATNGAVSIWDINKFGRNKQLNVYHDHDRTTHAVEFHHTDPFLLLSASQDSTLRLFDLRDPNSSVSTFNSTESVRDVKFNPFNNNQFASVCENGTVARWDLRKPEKFVQQFTAHSGPIYCVDYHPTQQWLATGSRDKLIKIWNMSSAKPTLEYTIHTIAVVGRVRWRPERKYQIASCSLVVDYSIYIWDVRRPFIPYASFNEHTNVTTDICFKGVPDVLLSTSKDSTIYKHATQDAQHPAMSANPQSGSINYRGDLLFVCKTKSKAAPATPISSASSSATKLNFLKKVSQDTVDSGEVVNGDSFHLAKSSLHFFTMETNEVAMDSGKIDDAVTKTLKKDFMFFQGCATDYKLTTDSHIDFLSMLDHNGNVAKKHGRSNVAMLWNLVKMIYKTAPSKRFQHVNYLTSQISNQSSSALSGITRASGSFGNAGLGMVSSHAASSNNIHPDGSVDHPAQSIFGGSTNDDLLDQSDQTAIITVPKVSIPDLEVEVFDENMNHNTIDSQNLRNGFLYTGPHDNIIKELPNCSSSIINHDLSHAQYKSNRSEMEREIETSPPPDPPCILTVPDSLEISFWKPFQVLADCLTLQSEIGDVQTPTSILICLGERRDDLPIDKFIQENWLQSYVDLLHRHQMWNEATEIINMSWIPSVSQMNEQSTLIQTTCGECGRTLQKGWFCKNCKSTDPSKCVVCHLVVKGIFAWCSGCCHGGHIEHIQQWFQTNPRCPKCNHLCEYD